MFFNVNKAFHRYLKPKRNILHLKTSFSTYLKMWLCLNSMAVLQITEYLVIKSISKFWLSFPLQPLELRFRLNPLHMMAIVKTQPALLWMLLKRDTVVILPWSPRNVKCNSFHACRAWDIRYFSSSIHPS